MGSLNLPKAGPVYLDTNGFIYSVERLEPYAGFLEPLWFAARDQQFEIVCSELVILETLVKPLRERDEKLCEIFRALLLESLEVRMIPTTRAIWESAAELRARLGFKTPDAIHAASALAEESTLLVTNDPRFRRLTDLPVVIMREAVEDGPE
jgi:predicted nucleic acid-binding protein